MGKAWKKEEDAIILNFVLKNGKHWDMIASILPHRTTTQISAHWEKCLDPSLIKGPFTPQEDEIIINFVKEHGPQNWPLIKEILPARSPKQCRERWCNHLSPNISKKEWSPEEDNFIFTAVMLYGPKWSNIAKLIPGRTDNSIKNRFNSSIAKRIVHDPETGKASLKADIKTQKRQNKLDSSQSQISDEQQVTYSPPFISQSSNTNSIQINVVQRCTQEILQPSLETKKAPFVLPMINANPNLESVQSTNSNEVNSWDNEPLCFSNSNQNTNLSADMTCLSNPELLPEPGFSLDDIALSSCGTSSEINDLSSEFKPEPGFSSSFTTSYEMQFPAEAFLTPSFDDEMFEFNEILKQE